MGTTHLTPLRFPLVLGVFPFVASVLFTSLWPLPGFAGHFRPGAYGPPVLLPVVERAPRAGETAHDSYITVQSDGSVFLNSKWYPDPEFPTMFRVLARTALPHAGSRVFLRADRSVPFGTVRSLLRSLRDIGIGEATLIVEPRDEYGPPSA